MPTASALVDLENLRPDVDSALESHLADLAIEVGSLSPATAALTDQAAALLRGGKRLRAAFCYWSYRAHGGAADGPGRYAAVRSGAALELFQAAALLHDDVMDASDTRRGRPTAHRVFEHRHAAAGWTGDAERFGTAAAILLGDLALVACQREMSAAVADLPPVRAQEARALFDAMQTEVVVGQYLDILVQARPWGMDPSADEQRARTVIRSKSARYSVERPLALGAVLAGASPEQVASIAALGLPVGEAFQLRDDVLGVFGDPEVTGKPAGDDLREGKRTVLVARTMARADAAGRDLLTSSLGDPQLGLDDVARLRATIADCGALDAVEGLIADLSGNALGSLAEADLDPTARAVLVDLARAAVDRAA